MGLIKKILGGIFGLIGGFFGGIAKIFGIGKQGEFYMEIDETAAPATPPSPETAKSEPVKVAQKASEPVPVAASDPQPSTAPAAASAPVLAAEKQPEVPTVKNFATDYLINPQFNRSPRRRPGPSMSPFKNMVKDMGRKSASMG
ncbi:MAG: hypothetical protein AAF827_06525 [Cyanobacteria bacterium P01_D01_bin.6]